jgi:hypothetical protein
MSVHRIIPGASILDFVDLYNGKPICFWCSEEVNGIGVIWAGHNASICFHPTCAKEFSCELIGDARNAIRLIEGKPIDHGLDTDLR